MAHPNGIWGGTLPKPAPAHFTRHFVVSRAKHAGGRMADNQGMKSLWMQPDGKEKTPI
jgi:hypothetical protein